MFVKQQFSVIEIRALDQSGATIRNRHKFLKRSFAFTLFQALQAFAHGLGYSTGHGLTGGLGKRLGQPGAPLRF